MAHHSLRAASKPLSRKLIEQHALIFDVYGTLIDWESAIHDAFAPLFPNLTREAILVQYAGVEGNLQRQLPNTPYAALLELAYRQLTTPSKTVGMTPAGVAEACSESNTSHTSASNSTVEQERGSFTRFSNTPPSENTLYASASNSTAEQEGASFTRCSNTPLPGLQLSGPAAQRFGESISDWKPFPDTIDALHRLKKRFALVVLSNVDDASFAGTHALLCSAAHPGSAYPTLTPESPFSLVLTAQQVGAYKPDPAMLRTALRQLSAHPDPSLPSLKGSTCVESSRVLVVANSIRHDIMPAKHDFELCSVWIRRDGKNFIGNEGVMHYSENEGAAADDVYPYTWRYETLGGLADAVEEEARLN